MNMPFYVAPEQVMKDRADYARKGIARGRSLVAVICAEGVLICAENPSSTLRKVSEIYDRIAFAGVGKYSEFDQLRISGVRAADLKGYSFSREDVEARSLANQYAQILGQVFTHEMKPLEVEILVVEVGLTPERDQLFHLLYDGTVLDESISAVLGGDAEAVTDRVKAGLATSSGGGEPFTLAAALSIAVTALQGPERTLTAEDFEVALLERDAVRRCFRRLSDEEVAELLASVDHQAQPEPPASSGQPEPAETAPGAPSGTAPPPAAQPEAQPEA